MGGRACVFVRVSAVRVCTVLVRGLGMNGRVCSFCVRVRYACVQYPSWAWACLRTPYRLGCTARVSTGLEHYISTCARTVRCLAGAVRAVYLVFVCVFVYGGRRVQFERCTTRREYVYACVVQYMAWWLGRRP